MSAELELLGVVKATGATWSQPRSEMTDVSGYTEASLMCTVFGGTLFAGSTTTVWLQTAVDDAEERWVTMAQLATYTDNPSPPENHYICLQGPGAGSGSHPGFARYLRVRVEQNASSELTFDVQAIMKP